MAARTPAPARTLTLPEARARWAHAQGLVTPAAADPQAVVAATGWLRTLGGVDAYLALAARLPGVSRARIDADVAAGRLRIATAARGCVYLIPEQHRGLALALAEKLQRPRLEKDAQRAALPFAEVEDLATAVLEVLAAGPRTTDGVRAALPAGSVRSLGELGKKVGVTTPLPVTLRHLELAGRIERMPVGGVLDTERYHWHRTEQAPERPAEPLIDLAHFFFQVAGPATLDHFAEWSGLGKREAAAAMAPLDLTPVAVTDFAPLAWLPTAALAEPADPSGTGLLAFEDNLFVQHGGTAPLTDTRHHHQPLAAWGAFAPSTLGTARHVSERTLVQDACVVGTWEWDAAAGEIVTALFDGQPHRSDLADAVAATARLLKAIGHARSYLLDADEAVARRAERLRARQAP